MTPLIAEFAKITKDAETWHWFDAGNIPEIVEASIDDDLFAIPYPRTSFVGMDTDGSKFCVALIAGETRHRAGAWNRMTRPGAYPRTQVRLHHKALIWFSANPDEYLTLQDMQDKWGGSMDAITTGLRYAVDAGLLVKSRQPDDTSPNGRRTRYEAGPAIKMVLGLEEE